jgi:hypothetical protein
MPGHHHLYRSTWLKMLPRFGISRDFKIRCDETILTDVLDVEAALAEPVALEEEPEAVEEPEAAAGVAAVSFSTPAVNTTGTPAISLPERLVVITVFVFIVVTPATSISRSRVT